MDRLLGAVDPGLSGGIAWRTVDGEYHACKMPQTVQDLHHKLHEITHSDPHAVFLMEKVGKHRMGNSAQSSATFARHVGHLEMSLVANAIMTEEITATKWMKEVVPGRPKGVESAQVRARKNYIKDKMQRKHPYLKVTLATADALGVLDYLVKNQEQY